MKLYMFAVYDKAVMAYMQPMFFRSKGEAIRSFTDAVADEKSTFRRHAEDYLLMELGVFDDQSGIVDEREPTRVVSAHEVMPVDRGITGTG